jgi:hypothetical protein
MSIRCTHGPKSHSPERNYKKFCVKVQDALADIGIATVDMEYLKHLRSLSTEDDIRRKTIHEIANEVQTWFPGALGMSTALAIRKIADGDGK